MRVAFVGKGGSGKSTLAALYARHLADSGHQVLAIDADINLHLARLLGFSQIPPASHLSDHSTAYGIKEYLRGSNSRIKSTAEFKKTTPPGTGSRLITLQAGSETFLDAYAVGQPPLRLMVVGTYDTDEIGTSCYHNDLAVLENVLSHLTDTQGTAVVDMVAGVDAFANTMHIQFDLLVLCVEPTWRGVEVYKQYKSLAQEAGVGSSLVVIATKTMTEADRAYIHANIASEDLVADFPVSGYLRSADQMGGALDPTQLELGNLAALDAITERLKKTSTNPNERLKKLHSLHKKYVQQEYIRAQHGDLESHIDPTFSMQADS